jgi:ABC-2 type transport system permease protein
MNPAYLAALTSGMRRALGTPGELIVRISFYLVILVVFSALWGAAVDANDGSIAGYSFVALLWYVAAAEGAVVATKPRMIEEIGDDIGSGSITTEMLRPVSVVGFRLAAELGEALVRLAFAVASGGVFVVVAVGPPPDAVGALLAVPALVLAVACNIAAQHIFAAAAFWVEDAKASWFLYQKVVFLLGGMLLPLEMLPGPLAAVARALPFWTTAYVPGRLLSGHPEWPLLGIQLVWLGVLVGSAAYVFHLGERRLQAVGG